MPTTLPCPSAAAEIPMLSALICNYLSTDRVRVKLEEVLFVWGLFQTFPV